MMEHALLSASGASRWMACTAAPRYEEQFPETTSGYAEHGRIAHEMAELKVKRQYCEPMGPKTYSSRLNKLKKAEKEFVETYNAKNPDTKLEIGADKYTDDYLQHINEIAMSYTLPPFVAAEVKVDLTDYIPAGFGTCDCIMIGGNTLDIVDFKFGVGVPVPAKENPQMRLYALGALKMYKPFYGDRIKTIRMTIDQPRVQSEPDSEIITTDELLVWGETVKPIAAAAYSGFGEFKPGEHCRFCRGKAICKARAEQNSALADFAGITTAPVNAGRNPDTMSPEEMGQALTLGKLVTAWYSDLTEYALSETLSGKDIPGWKAVEGRSNRTFADQDAAFKEMVDGGVSEEMLYERKPITLTAVEKLLGKSEFAKIAHHVIKPPGKPTLVPESDKREPFNSAASDFKGVSV
ncbi:DUF2800 domain-containing protein [Eubacteriales bacterium OttesenSCG-928-G02]|nr:DUF2800 domain-containing protein [Eubacteriales bacterium OttesenSCG-928-G02]